MHSCMKMANVLCSVAGKNILSSTDLKQIEEVNVISCPLDAVPAGMREFY